MALKIFIIVVAIFLYSFNLHATQSFVGDSARDTVRMMEIWRNKEVTLLGPPLSLGYGSAKEVYFGSLSLYIGLLGIVISNLDPVGAVIPNILIFALSIPFFFSWVRKFTTEKTAYIATVIYAWNPLTVNYARFFWNPNLIIPLSVFFWYFISTSSYLLAGLVVGVMFNLHYLGILGGVLYGVYLLIKKEWINLIKFVGGFLIGIIPILAFEIRNNFYLSKTLWWNVASGEKIWSLIEKPPFIVGLANSFLTPLGVIHSEMKAPMLIDLAPSVTTMIALVLVILIFRQGYLLYLSKPNLRPHLIILLSAIILVNLSDAAGHSRYIWSVIPITILVLSQVVSGFKNRFITIAIIVFILANSLVNVWTPRSVFDGTLSISTLANISKIIVADNPTGHYNITETMSGDARFVSLRYFLLRDAVVKPQSEESYTGLDRLYIVTKKGQRPLASDRWEFGATPNLVETNSFETDGLEILRYERK